MVEIKGLNEEDIPKYLEAFVKARELLGSFEGNYYKLYIDGEERLLHHVNDLMTIYYLSDEGLVNCQMFTVDENYNVVQVGYDSFEIAFVDNQVVASSRDEKQFSYLTVEKRPNGNDREGFNGLIVYAQFNAETDKRVVIGYPQMYLGEKTRIYPARLEKPLTIKFDKKVMVSQAKGKEAPAKTYIRHTFDYSDNPKLFSIVTIKDFGLEAILKQNPVALQKGDRVTRYFKMLFQNKDGLAVTGFPLCSQYSQEEINTMIENNGFRASVPQILVDIYNGDDYTLRLCQEVATLMKKVSHDLEKEEDCKKLVLEINLDGEMDEDN